MSMTVRLFISHSSNDVEIVKPLLSLLKNGLRLSADEIRCTSVDGCRLPGGADTEEFLRREVNDADAFVGIISPASLRSMYVAFELGARWGVKRHLLPILAPGCDASVLAGPLEAINALRCDNRSQLQQVVDDLAEVLNVQPERPSALNEGIDAVLSAANKVINAEAHSATGGNSAQFATTQEIRIEPAAETIISDEHVAALPVVPSAIKVIQREAAKFVSSSLVELILVPKLNGGQLILSVPILSRRLTLLDFAYHRRKNEQFGSEYPVHIEEYLSQDGKAVHEVEDEEQLRDLLRETFGSPGAKSKIEKILQTAKSRLAERKAADGMQ